jgi:fibronectin type 3 domain-containing protein
MNPKILLTRAAIGLIGLLLSLATAQKTGELPILPTPNGAILRWYLPAQTFPSRGFRLERTNPDGSRSNIAISSPMPKPEVERQKLLDPKLYDYLQKLYSNPPKDSNEKFQRGIFDLKALASSNMARVMGILFEDKGLQAGKKYVYRVIALGSSETLVGLSSVVTGQTPAVPVVEKISSSQTPGRISLSWAVPKNGNGDIVAYRVFKAESNIFVPVQVEPLFPSGAIPNFVDDQISPDKIYQYRISSIDIFGREGQPSQAISVDASLAAPLVPPRILEIATPDDRLELRFTPNQDKRVSQILIYRGSDIDKLTLLTKIAPNAKNFTDSKVIGGISYAYALAVQSGSSISPRSPAKVATAINSTPPKTPSQAKISSSTNSLSLTWAANPEPDLWGYLIYRSTNKDTALKDAVLLNPTPLKTPKFTDTLLQGSTLEYSYQIVAINTSAIRSQPSQTISASLTDQTPPATPILLNVSPLENSVGLTFSSSDPDTTQILIYRVSPQGRLQLIKKLAANATGYIDTTAIANLPYVYTIIAIDKNGNRSQASNRMVGTAVLTQAPPVPSVKIQISNNTAVLTWTRAKPRTYFIIYQQRGTQWIQISEVIDATSYTLQTIKKGEKYALRSIDLAGNLSEYSNTLEIR